MSEEITQAVGAPLERNVRPLVLSRAADDVIAERVRQTSVEGWTPEHDDQHADGSLAWAAVSYAMPEPHRFGGCYWRMGREYGPIPPVSWPDSWHVRWWKPKDRRRDLVRAAALLIAELERLDRGGA